MEKNENIIENTFAFKGRVLWIFTKYQIITKILLYIIVYPIYSFIVKMIIHSSGRVGISSGDFLSFLFSLNGIYLLIITLFLMAILIGVDINTYIYISALIKENKMEISLKNIIGIGLKSLKMFCSPLGILSMIYVSLILPLVGVGITISPMQTFQIPHFITSVIYSNSFYLSLYVFILVIFLTISYLFIFSFHNVLILNYDIKSALKYSFKLSTKYWKEFLNEIIFKELKKVGLLICVFIVNLIIIYLFGMLHMLYNDTKYLFISIFFVFVLFELSAYVTLIIVPVIILKITQLFYKLNKLEGKEINLKGDFISEKWDVNSKPKIKNKTKIAFVLFIVFLFAINAYISELFMEGFSELTINNKKIEVIAHRGGGDLGAENTIEGIKAAIEKKLDWTEIDIQRTKDNHYVLNHDGTFKRLTGDNRKSYEMTLDEIKKLKVKNEFNKNSASQEVATLDEVIDTTKGKIGLFIELKGTTADKRMVDDVVKRIKEEKLEDSTVLLSLNYSLIKYCEDNYPDIKTGYLYFFSLGSVEKFVGDYLIMEESEATIEKVEKIKESGKKVVVWTVNTDESIEKFIESDVDGIITDYAMKVKEALYERKYKMGISVLIDSLLQ